MDDKQIAFEDITVVVQGAIVGKPTDPYHKRLTYRCLRSIRKHMPGSYIILSTWKDENTEGLDFDELVECEDPGPVESIHFGLRVNNINRQIRSSYEGLRAVKTPYALKFRNDLLLDGSDFVGYFGKFTNRDSRWMIFRERLVIGNIFSRNPNRTLQYPFHPSDWYQFGYTDDVLKFWDLPLATPPFNHLEMVIEQYLWTEQLNKQEPTPIRMKRVDDNTPEHMLKSEVSLMNNFVLLEQELSKVKFMKYRQDHMENLFAMYTFQEWKRLYDEFCRSAHELKPMAVRPMDCQCHKYLYL